MSIYLNYKDVNVLYNSSGIFCKNIDVEVQNSLEVARDRNTITNGDIYGTSRPITNVQIDYLIGTDGDIFYKNFKDIFNGRANFAEFTNTLDIGELSLSNVYPQSLSISAQSNSEFTASVNLTYFGNLLKQISGSNSNQSYEDYVSIGHLANSPISGVDYGSSISCSFSIQSQPIFFMGNSTFTPNFVDIINRGKTCDITTNNLQKIVSVSGDYANTSFDVKDFNGTALQNYEVSGRIISHSANLRSEDVMEGQISIQDFN